MNTIWKIGIQVGLVLLAGAALMLSGGVAAAAPSAAPPGARAECSVVQLPGMDLQLGEPGACVSVLLPRAGEKPSPATPASAPVDNITPPTPVSSAAPPAPVGNATQPTPAEDGSQPTPIGNGSQPTPIGNATQPTPIGNANAPAQQASPPYPCLDVQLPGLRIRVVETSPPAGCFVAPTA